MTELTKQEAYLAMFAFLDEYYDITKSEDIGALLGNMSLLEDGYPADPTMLEDWLRAIEKVQSNQIDASLKLSK